MFVKYLGTRYMGLLMMRGKKKSSRQQTINNYHPTAPISSTRLNAECAPVESFGTPVAK